MLPPDCRTPLASASPSRVWRVLLFVSLFVALLGSRWEFIRIHGSDVPWGDQWYGEAATLYLPHAKGELDGKLLFAPHNEHRIVLTRLLNLALLELNHQWDPRVQLLTNAVILAAAVVVLVAGATRGCSFRLTALTAALAYGLFSNWALWENALNGFQSQFYLLLLFALLHVLLTTASRRYSGAWWLGQVAAVLALGCMAMGFIGPLAVLLWLAWRWRAGLGERADLGLAAWNVALLAGGLALIPFSPSTSGADARAWTALPVALLEIMGWPQTDWTTGWFLYAPLFVFLIIAATRPSRVGAAGPLVALACFALLHVGAIAAARGSLASRYGDILSMALVANFLCGCAVPVVSARARFAKMAGGGLWLLWVGLGLWHGRLPHETRVTLHALGKETAERLASIRAYHLTGNAEELARTPSLSSLDVWCIRETSKEPRFTPLLPPSLSLPLPRERAEAPAAGSGFAAEGTPSLPGILDHLPTWSSTAASAHAPAEFAQRYASTPFPLLTVYFAGTLAPPATSLHLVSASGQEIAPLQTQVSATSRWRRVNFSNPGGPFQIVARDTSAAHWIAFSEPFGIGRLTWLAGKLLGVAGPLQITGVAGAFAALLAGTVVETRKRTRAASA